MSLDLSRLEPAPPASGAAKRPEPGRGLPGLGDLPDVPRPLLMLSAVVVVVGAAVVFLGAWQTGVSWDETYHVLRMRNYLDSGWYLLDGDLLGDQPGPWEDQQYVYGPATMLLLHGWSLVWGVEGASGVAASPEAYAVRHLAVALIAMVGVAAAGAVTRILLHRWSWGLVTAGVLLALPVWAGHAMFNVKDVPVATGYTLATLGLVLLVVGPASSRATVGVVGGAVTLAAGVVLAVGTRPGIWPGIALAVAVALVTRDRRRIAGIGVALVTAYVVLLGIYPAVFSTPVTALLGAALESSRYGGATGHWWYLPLFLLVEIPTGYLVLGVLATALLLRGLLRGPRLQRLFVDSEGVVVLLVLLQCFALPVLAIARQSNIYTGVRQMLFAAPALAVLVTLGIAVLIRARERSSSTWVRRLVPAGIAAALVGPVVAQLQLFPYSYAYSSVPANLAAPVVERMSDFEVPTDYWRTSVRELSRHIPVGGWVTCSPASDTEGRWLRYSRESHDNCATDLVGPLAAYDHLRSGGWEASPTSFLAVETGESEIAPNCTRLADVRRWLYWRHVEMGFVAECELVLVPYPAGGLDFEGEGDSGKNLMGGWSIHQADRGIGVRDDQAELGFELPAVDAANPLRFAGTALGGRGMTVEVNGEPVEVTVDEGVDHDELSFEVAASTAAAYGAGRVVLAVGDRDGDLRLLSLRLEGAP